MTGAKLTYLLMLVAALAFIMWQVLGCASVPSCRDNPRNMRCMTADQLEKELSK